MRPLPGPRFFGTATISSAPVSVHTCPGNTGSHSLTATARKVSGSVPRSVRSTYSPTPVTILSSTTVRLRRRPARAHFTHGDGTPFLWLADTWWYGATGRCGWPQPFQDLVDQRARQGFNVVQLVIGIPPEVGADDVSIPNEGGVPFAANGT